MIHSSAPEDESLHLPEILPILPVKDAVVFPYIILPLSLSEESSVLAVEQALSGERLVLLMAQRDVRVEDPAPEDLYEIGTVGVIMRMLKLPDGRIRILVQGLVRARLESVRHQSPFLQGRVRRLEDVFPEASSSDAPKESLATEAMIRNAREHLEQIVHLGRQLTPEVMVVAANLEDPGRLADLVASNLDLEIRLAQALLETADPIRRLRAVCDHLAKEIELLMMQQQISNQAQEEIDRAQREYYLRQKLKAIREELGESDEIQQEIEEYRRLASEKQLSEEAAEELEKQIRRLERSHPDSSESSVIRTYLDWLTRLPWNTFDDEEADLQKVREVLDEDHYGLEKIKERIFEFLAVRRLKSDAKGPILCFVGPPGVGKTSLGRSIARALGRKFIRLSLGGVRDEAEIRGHRRTYVGALPGRIIQGLHRAQTANPVFMLDEIDKIGSDHRGDPSSALLEVLDPEQNTSFRDHYLGIPFDLSKVIFITTANLMDPIDPAFRDRMEVIRLSGYTEEEKLKITRRHLIPKQYRENGVTEEYLRFTNEGILRIIREYTRESGLRNLEREIGAICRKAAVRIVEGNRSRWTVGPRRLGSLLGPSKHFHEALLDQDRIGVATGLAWTAVGGDLLFVEVVAVPGKGELRLTGSLGEVMKESAHAALTYARSYAARRGLAQDFFVENNLHIHAPAGSIPKDGPSAGITIAGAILSVFLQRAVDRTVAMTGEITLQGDILPIGGLKEKLLAARAAGIQRILIPYLNQKDLVSLPKTLKKSVDIHPVRHMDEALDDILISKELN